MYTDGPDSRVSLALTEDGAQLLASHSAGGEATPLDLAQLKEMITSQGFGDLFLLGDALETLIRHGSAAADITLVIGERRNATCSITIAPDLLSAHLTITPAHGGTNITAEQIFAALQDQGITFGVKEETVHAAVTAKAVHNELIAVGIAPLAGEDTQFISLIREAKHAPGQCDDMAIIDYRSFDNIITVKEGDPLLRRLPPTEGIPGTTVQGKPLPALPGNDRPFSGQITGAATDEHDPDLLVATIAGQPFLLPDGVTVEPIITIKDVDLTTGNLDIEGSLTINGDVKPGMHVKATADILIEGMVEAGHIEAGGDVEIKGAIIGQGEPRGSGGSINPTAATVQVKGSLKALFVENAVITAGGSIVIQEFAMKSELHAGNSILVGEPGSNKGRIISSICRATAAIEATSIGSRAGAGTILEVGLDPTTHERFMVAKQTLHAREREREETTKALDYFRDNPSRATAEAITEKKKVLSRLQTEIQELSGQLRRLKKRFDLLENARITAEHQVFCGVKLSIGEKTLQLENDMPGATFTLGEDGIVF
jgi:uncharacterized protein